LRHRSIRGTWLASTCGYLLEPGPRAPASFEGFGDNAGAFEADPRRSYRQFPLVTREDADRSVGSVAISQPAADGDRSIFHGYGRQQGQWLAEVTGHDLR